MRQPVAFQQKAGANKSHYLSTISMLSEKLDQLKLQPVQGYSAFDEEKQGHDGIIIGSYSRISPKNPIQPHSKVDLYTGFYHRMPVYRRPVQKLLVEDQDLFNKIEITAYGHFDKPDHPHRVALNYIKPYNVWSLMGIDRGSSLWAVKQSDIVNKFEATDSYQRHGYQYEEEPFSDNTVPCCFDGYIYHVSRWGAGPLYNWKRFCSVHIQSTNTIDVKEDIKVGKKEGGGSGLALGMRAGLGIGAFMSGHDIYTTKEFPVHSRSVLLLLSEEGSKFAEDIALSNTLTRFHWVVDKSPWGRAYRIRKMQVINPEKS